jgi:hypothetical protein
MPLVAQIGMAVVTIAIAGMVVTAIRRKAVRVPVVGEHVPQPPREPRL